MTLTQVGSLNGFVQTRGNSFSRRWIGGEPPSADTLGRVACLVEGDGLREIIKNVYSKQKRNKSLLPGYGGMFGLIVDGHESHTSYLQNCEGCLERVVHKTNGDVTQYYHRYVMAQLVCGNFCLPIDMEPQKPGEDEVATAARLLERVLKNYPRAFDVILADGLYVRAGFFRLALDHGKDVIAVSVRPTHLPSGVIFH